MPAGKAPRRLGFTLVEALAAVAITGFAVASLLGGLGAIARAESRAKETELMTRLAADKFEEMAATREYLTSASNGDFRDIGEERYTWSAQVGPSGVENLDALTVTVTRAKQSGDVVESITGLVYAPPATTTGAGGNP